MQEEGNKERSDQETVAYKRSDSGTAKTAMRKIEHMCDTNDDTGRSKMLKDSIQLRDFKPGSNSTQAVVEHTVRNSASLREEATYGVSEEIMAFDPRRGKRNS